MIISAKKNANSRILREGMNIHRGGWKMKNEAMLGMGFPEFVVDGYIELNEGFSNGFADTSNGNVKTLTGHKPCSVDDFTRDFKGYFSDN